MGSHLSAILSSQKDKSIAITSRKSHPSSNNIRYIAGNAHDNAFLDELLTEKYDVIVDFMVYNTDEFRKRATKLLKSCTQYVFISSSRVYADTEMVITEDSPRLLDTCTDEEYLTTDEYALTKARQENILKTAGGGKLDDYPPVYHLCRESASTGRIGIKRVAVSRTAGTYNRIFRRHRRTLHDLDVWLRCGTRHSCHYRQRRCLWESFSHHRPHSCQMEKNS